MSRLSDEVVLDALKAGLHPIPALSVSQWADAYRVLSRESSARPGRWNGSMIPYQAEPMDAPLDPDVSEVVLQWAAQLGKSEVLLNTIGYFAHADPAPVLVVQPTVDLAEAFSKERIAPMIRDSPALADLIRDPRSRDSGNTLLSKVYPGGNMALIGANAPSGLAGRPRRVVLQDEIDRFPVSAGTEGDPTSLADKRAESFPNAVKIKTSTPTIKGFSKIEALLENSDMRKWHVCCTRCGGEQVLAWSQVKFTFKEGDKTITAPERACLVCEHCKAELTDEDRIKMVREGQWKETKPFAGIRGYWLNGLNTLFKHHRGYKNRLHQMAKEFLDAKSKGPEALKTWVNTFLAETWEESGEVLTANPIMARRENYGPKIPRHCLALLGKADVQADRIEAEIEGIGLGGESWGIRYQIIVGQPQLPDVWRQLDEFFMQTFEHESGSTMKVDCALVDCGYEQDLVLQYTKPREGGRIFACKGSSTPNAPVVARGTRHNQQRALVFQIGTNAAKDLVFGRLRLNELGPGYCHFPVGYGYDEEFFLQLTAEKAVTRFHMGQAMRVYQKTRARNEALDLRVYGVAAAHILKPNLVELHKQLNGGDVDEERPADAPAPTQVPRPAPELQVVRHREPISRRRPLGGVPVG